ncbi:zinc-ribbon domain-containing protein [Virgibacillus sp. 179-BFC.A HS]|uniref:Zinc-ribbon domain-containing protein n=1 Tax=Tigheibacillus jepli TaxID=3035914 RepID=A0ABU5CDJ0_9BACI|nr:zinc-ribbon domain-containing protein [Virgibacillus sp. 179-BFC.A HS]MDY0404341.1 zinc-ribbon domain-containing protein [Virgibacillus sp. 179-BFC.A HS]
MILYCSNCGYKLPDNVNFCPNCGTALSAEMKSMLATPQENVPIVTSENPKQDMTDELVNFIGPNAVYYMRCWKEQDAKHMPINFAALFLSFFWLGYRKMYKPILIAAAYYLLMMLIASWGNYTFTSPFIFDPLSILFTLVVHVIVACFGNQWYERHVMDHIAHISNSNLPKSQKLALYQAKGGVGFAGVILAGLILLIMFNVPPHYFSAESDEINTIRYGALDIQPELEIDSVFRDVFDNGSWNLHDRYGETSIISFDGSLVEDGKSHDVSIQFYTVNHSKRFELATIIVDGDELDSASAASFLDYIFERYQDR